MHNPLITICVPTFNGEKYLRECLDSCLSQTFRDFEIVICDDGSVDTTVSIVEDYAKKNGQIKFHQNDHNLGLVGNWNKCITLASGSWIKFLFQDDAMNANCLQRFCENMEGDSELIVCKRHFVLDKDATLADRDYYTNAVRTLENTGHYTSTWFSPKTISHIAAENISLNFIAEPSLMLFSKHALRQLGLFDKELKQICDLEFGLRLASNYGLRYIPETLCLFRIHAHSTTEKNLSSKNYWYTYLEAMAFAMKLVVKPEFKNFRTSITPLHFFKLKLYIKYKSYIAHAHIRTKEEGLEYELLKKNYPGLFYKKLEVVYLKPFAFLKSAN